MLGTSSLDLDVAPVTVPGLIGDPVFPGRSPGLTLAAMAAVNYPIGAVCIGLGLGHFRRALDEAAGWRDEDRN